ncbi:hypothetical protein HKX48_003501 [Thoreauomyces humboldtii]|nr:hypothetical protein HKX48_003501 [Thoreauomyces humboldtii]
MASQSLQCPYHALPTEIHFEILKRLTSPTILTLMQTCRRMHHICTNDSVWQERCAFATYPCPESAFTSLMEDSDDDEDGKGRTRGTVPYWKTYAADAHSACFVRLPDQCHDAPWRSYPGDSIPLPDRVASAMRDADGCLPDSMSLVAWFRTPECDNSWELTNGPYQGGIIVGGQTAKIGAGVLSKHLHQLLYIGADGVVRGSFDADVDNPMEGVFVGDGKWHCVGLTLRATDYAPTEQSVADSIDSDEEATGFHHQHQHVVEGLEDHGGSNMSVSTDSGPGWPWFRETMYVDGVQTSAADRPYEFIDLRPAHFQIGTGFAHEDLAGRPGRLRCGWYPFHGALHDLRFYNRCLSIAEVRQHTTPLPSGSPASARNGDEPLYTLDVGPLCRSEVRRYPMAFRRACAGLPGDPVMEPLPAFMFPPSEIFEVTDRPSPFHDAHVSMPFQRPVLAHDCTLKFPAALSCEDVHMIEPVRPPPRPDWWNADRRTVHAPVVDVIIGAGRRMAALQQSKRMTTPSDLDTPTPVVVLSRDEMMGVQMSSAAEGDMKMDEAEEDVSDVDPVYDLSMGSPCLGPRVWEC